MLSKEQAENFSALTSSPTVVRDTVPEDAFGSTALATANEMIDAAGEDIFHYNYRDWYGLGDRKSTRLNSSLVAISYAVFCLKKKKETGKQVMNSSKL